MSPQKTSISLKSKGGGARRSAGRPPKARPLGRPSKSSPKRSMPNKAKSKTRKPGSPKPKVVVVTNQPLVSEEEFAVWQAAREVEPKSEEIQTVSPESEDVDISSKPLELPDLSDNHQLPSRLYRNLAIFFIILIGFVIMVMFYYSFIKVKIILYPAVSQQKQNTTIYLTDITPVPSGYLPAKFIEQSTEYRETFRATGKKQLPGEGKLTGQVRLVNKTGKDQPLVATTRLLTSGGVLYRLKNFVTVPAGGEIKAEVYADQVKPENAVGANTKFTIPGLWSGLQDKIYAIAEEPIVFQSNIESIILDSDLEQAIVQAKEGAAEQVKALISQEAQDETIAYWLDDNLWEVKSDGQAGDAKSEFTVTVKATAGAAIFDFQTMVDLIKEQADSQFTINESTVVYQLSKWQPQEHYAELNVNYAVSIVATQAEELIDKRALIGLTREELEDYLSKQPGLLTYKIIWQPHLLKKVPGTDKIILQLAQ
jgi:hypothetical protein